MVSEAAPVVVVEGPVPAVGEWARSSRRQRAARGPAAGTRKGDGWRRSSTDERLLAWAGRFGVVSQAQAARSFYGGSESTARHRLGFMVRAGLLRSTDNVRWAGPVLWPTAAGMQAGGVERLAPPGMPTEERLMHKLLVSEQCLMLEDRGLVVLSERQVRSAESAVDVSAAGELAAELGVTCRPSRHQAGGQSRERWFGVPLDGGRVHWPDAVAVNRGSLLAVEVEITPKDNKRLFSVINAYKAAREGGHFAQVLWLVTRDVQTQIEGCWVQQSEGRAWRNGLFQEAGVIPSGPPDWKKPGLSVTQRRLRSDDDGLQYAIDQRTLNPSARSSFKAWKARRVVWLREAPEVDFEVWLSLPGILESLMARGL